MDRPAPTFELVVPIPATEPEQVKAALPGVIEALEGWSAEVKWETMIAILAAMIALEGDKPMKTAKALSGYLKVMVRRAITLRQKVIAAGRPYDAPRSH